MPSWASDLDRLRHVYARRDSLAYSDTYSLFNTAYLFLIQQRQRAMLELLRTLNVTNLADKRILEIGCGHGAVLREYEGLGATPSLLDGMDIIPDRVILAHQRLPLSRLLVADAQQLPYASSSFDLVLQCTVFTSILDSTIKANIAHEMQRVLHRDGIILWYDFWLNPSNPQTRGIRPSEIRRIFPNCLFHFRRITLTPPVARRLVPISWVLGTLLESLVVLNSHYLVAIQRDGKTA